MKKMPVIMKTQETDDSGGIEGVTEEFMVHLARVVKDTQADEKCWYHCSSPEHFIHNCPLVKTLREKKQLNGKEETASMNGAQIPPTMTGTTKSPRQRLSRPETIPQTPFFNVEPFQHWYGVENMARVRINGEGCMSLLDQWCPDQYHHT